MRGDDERHYPPGVVPGAVGALGAIAAAVLVVGVVFGLLLAHCSRAEPVQMIPTPAVSSAAIATSSAQATGTQGIRIVGRRVRAPEANASQPSNGAKSADLKAPEANASDGDSWEWVIEASQSLTAAATSSAQASASLIPDHIGDVTAKVTDSRPLDHGRLGVIAATMPGILAADVELARVDVPPWLVGVPLEVGLDLAGNLEAGAAGVSVGGKAFAIGGAWSRWNLTERGLFLAGGLRF